MQFLQKGNLFLQGFHFTLQVKTCQRGIVNILFWKEKKKTRKKKKQDMEEDAIKSVAYPIYSF